MVNNTLIIEVVRVALGGGVGVPCWSAPVSR